jgi:hypothetical protein
MLGDDFEDSCMYALNLFLAFFQFKIYESACHLGID